MLENILTSNVSRLLKQRNSFLLFGVGMLVTNIILAIAVIEKTEKVILVPPQINQTFWVRGGEVSEGYIEEMSVFLIDLLLDQTPSNSGYKREMLLRYVDASKFSNIEKELLEQESYIKENDISTDFHAASIKVKVDSSERSSMISGDLITYVADKKVSTSRVSYYLTFNMVGSKLFLTSFDQEKESE